MQVASGWMQYCSFAASRRGAARPPANASRTRLIVLHPYGPSSRSAASQCVTDAGGFPTSYGPLEWNRAGNKPFAHQCLPLWGRLNSLYSAFAYEQKMSLRASAHTGVAIRSPFSRSENVPTTQRSTDCHVGLRPPRNDMLIYQVPLYHITEQFRSRGPKDVR